jgi:CspA family cold shock protein
VSLHAPHVRRIHLQLIGYLPMTTPTQTGTVKWFNESKGFGFIAQDAGGADLFAHFRDIAGSGFKTLAENQRVEFEVKQGQKGLQAANIRVLA